MPSVKRAATHPHPAFPAMLAESQRTGLPLTFKNDLLVHDSGWLTTQAPSHPFVWVLRDSGTHIVALDWSQSESGRIRDAAHMLASIADSFGVDRCRFFLWDGAGLQPMASLEAAQERVRDYLERYAYKLTFRTVDGRRLTWVRFFDERLTHDANVLNGLRAVWLVHPSATLEYVERNGEVIRP